MSSVEVGSRKRKVGTVEAPTLQEIFSPVPHHAKKRRGEEKIDVPSWSVTQVAEFVRGRGFSAAVVEAFEMNEIEGRHLLNLTREDLKSMGISTVAHQKDLLQLLGALGSGGRRVSYEKVFNDPIHGHIEIHPLMVKVIDTPQFQRLRYIKQLGGAYHVFPGASHNRFEHSIGVGFLAGELVETLQRKQPELDITDKDVLCVKIAGLCHDLGHGPFSHTFDGCFIPLVRPGTDWKHEKASVMMFEHLLKENNLAAEFENYGLDEQDIVFIKEQIAGPRESEMSSQIVCSDWPYEGRTEDKSFLYEVVTNKRNGIDVDKWDYFARDCHCLGIPNNFDRGRFMKFARVIEVNGRLQICTRDKESANLYEMFHTRSTLHRRAYQHKTAKIIEFMITESLVKANDHLKLPGCGGQMVTMSEAIWDPVAYTRLTDNIIHQILMSVGPELQESRELLLKIERRDLYKYIGKTQPSRPTTLQSEDLEGDIVKSLSKEELNDLPELTRDDIIVMVVTIDYGMKTDNPIDHVRFYTKENPNKAVKVRKDQVSQMLPHTFSETQIRVYCKKSDELSLQAAWKYFIRWCTVQDCVTPKGEGMNGVDEDGLTPYGTPFATPVKKDIHSMPLDSDDVVKKLQFSSATHFNN